MHKDRFKSTIQCELEVINTCLGTALDIPCAANNSFYGLFTDINTPFDIVLNYSK